MQSRFSWTLVSRSHDTRSGHKSLTTLLCRRPSEIWVRALLHCCTVPEPLDRFKATRGFIFWPFSVLCPGRWIRHQTHPENCLSNNLFCPTFSPSVQDDRRRRCLLVFLLTSSCPPPTPNPHPGAWSSGVRRRMLPTPPHCCTLHHSVCVYECVCVQSCCTGGSFLCSAGHLFWRRDFREAFLSLQTRPQVWMWVPCLCPHPAGTRHHSRPPGYK